MSVICRKKPAIKHRGWMPSQQRGALGLLSQRAGMVLALAVLLAPVVHAEPPPVPLEDNGVAPLPGTNAPNTARPAGAPSASTPGIPSNPYENYRWKGINVSLPPPANTIDLGLGGLRQKLADDYGIGYFGALQATFYDNVLHHANNVGGNQVYLGQKPTHLSPNFLGVTIDLSRYGIPDGQIVVVGSEVATSWQPAGPNTINLRTLSYYQTLLNKRIEIKAGLLTLNTEYAGTFIGGSLNGGVFGPSATIFGENGVGLPAFPQFGVNVTAHLTENVYDKFGVNRAVNPDGNIVEHNYNLTGISKFTTPNAGPLFVNELGYLRPAAYGAPQTWVRGGAILDKSRFVELNHPGLRSSNQYALYLLGDRQLTQMSSEPGQAYRGFYAGFSVEYAPPNYSPFSQYYEARLYGLGVIPGRPFDQASLVFTDNVFSNTVYRAARQAGQLAHSDSKSLTLSYSAQVTHGLYLNVGGQYVDNPSPIVYNSDTGSAFNLFTGTVIFF